MTTNFRPQMGARFWIASLCLALLVTGCGKSVV